MEGNVSMEQENLIRQRATWESDAPGPHKGMASRWSGGLVLDGPPQVG